MLKSIGGGWIKTSKSGTKYVSLSIEVNGEKINAMMFKNEEKKNPNGPDYRLVVREDDEQEQPKKQYKKPQPEEDINVSDIPF